MLNSKLGRKIPCSAFEHLLYGRSSEYETCKADSICPQKVPRHFREMGDIHQKSLLTSTYNKSTMNYGERRIIKWRCLKNSLLAAE